MECHFSFFFCLSNCQIQIVALLFCQKKLHFYQNCEVFFFKKFAHYQLLNFEFLKKALLSLKSDILFSNMTLFARSEECGCFELAAVNVNLKGVLQY